MRHLIAISTVVFLLLAAATHLAHAQSEPSISIELSPDTFVPMDTAITGTVTLRGLDPAAYSSVIFRADITPYGNAERRCNGDDTGTDIEIPVNSSSATFTARIYDACPSQYNTYGTYTLDLTVSRLDDTASGGRVELAAAQAQFGMSRYLTAGEAIPGAPTPGAVAWMSPDPTTLSMRALGEWQFFRFHSNVTKYLNDHMGVRISADLGHFAAGGGLPKNLPSESPEDACQKWKNKDIHWRRAIHQGLWIVACKAGDATILLIHETAATDPLYRYRITTLPADSPLTIAGRAQVGHTLTANTAGITDPDGLTAPGYTYQWLADDAAIAGATASTYTLVAADKGKAIKVRVSFTDDKGNGHALTSAATAAVVPAPIIIMPPPPNRPPVADAGYDQTVNEGDTVTLDGSGSSDPDPGDTLTYSWRSDGSVPTALTGRNPAFVAPAVDSQQQRIVLTLTVSDGSLTDADTVVIAVRNVPSSGTITPPPPPRIVIPSPSLLILPPLPPLLTDTTPPTILPTGDADPRGNVADCLTLVFNVVSGGPVTGANGTGFAPSHDGRSQTVNHTSSPALAIPDQQTAGDAIAVGWPGAAASVAVGLNTTHPVTNGPIVQLTSPDCAPRMPHHGTFVPGVDIFDMYNLDFDGTDAAGNWTLVVRDNREWWGGILNEWSLGMDTAGALPGSGRPYLVTAYAGLAGPATPDAVGDHEVAGKAGSPLAPLIPGWTDRTYTAMVVQWGTPEPAACR